MTPITKHFIFAFSCLLTSFSVLAQENIALHTRTGASGTTKRQPPAFLTDGDFNTYSESSKRISAGFHFEMDLEKEYNLDRIIIHNRFTFDYRVDIYDDYFGVRGALVWSAHIATHGEEDVDTLTTEIDPQGKFFGRYIRITNLSSVDYAPSIYEIEVFEAPLPVISYFETDAGNITNSGNASLPTSANISWQASGYDTLWIDQGVGRIETETGELEFTPTVNTNYTLTATNQYGSVSKSIAIAVDSPILDPVITEFLALNLATIEDEDGDNSDWIEIHNPNNFTLNVQDYYLTDVAAIPAKWKFPSRTIEPKGYLVVFASSKNRYSPETPLHTNFKLDPDGDYLALVAKNGSSVLQQFPENYPSVYVYPAQETNVSYGIDNSGVLGFFSVPTPGMVNGSIESGIVEEALFSPNRGVFNSPINVQIFCTTPGAIIRYTTDGSEPNDSSGSVYSSPIELSTTKIIRAGAFKEGHVSSAIKTHTYIFIDDVISSSVMADSITSVALYREQIKKGLVELPSISLVMDEEVNNTTEIKASAEWIDPIKNENLQVYSGIKYFGGSFTDFAKENFRLYFRGVHGDLKLEHPVFEGFEHSIPAVKRFDRLDLRAGGHDMGRRGFYMSNRLADDILLESGHLNPHGRFVHVYLNGVYWGQYHLRERWDDHMFAEYFDRSKEDFEAVSGNINVGGWSEYEIFYAGDGSTWEMAKMLRGDYMSLKEYVDLPQLIDFMLEFMYGNSESEYKTVGTKEPGVGFKFFFNDADGFTRDGSNRTNMDQPGKKPADGPGSIFSMLIKEGHPDFMTLLGDQIQDLFYNDGILTPDGITALINERCEEVENSIVAECARWGYLSPSTWTSKKNDYIEGVLPERTSEVIADLKAAGFYPSVDAPVFSKHGGYVPAGYQLKIISSEPEVYYTMNGSDPRLPGGNVSANALSYATSGTQYIQLVGEDVNVSAFVPFDASLGTSWTAADYTETASWLSSTKGPGVGYDTDPTYIPHIDLNVNDQMQGISNSVYLRYNFELSDLSDLNALILNMKYDDGFVAYLNGQIIASANAPASLAWNSAAAKSHIDGEAVNFVNVALSNSNAQSLLTTGKNVLAIQGLNLRLSSTDFLIEPELYVTKQGDAADLEYITITDSVHIKARAFDGAGTWSPIIDAMFEIVEDTTESGVDDVLVSSGAVLMTYPNPFREHTTLSFKVHEGTEAVLEVYDILGKRVWVKSFSALPGITYTESLETSGWQNGMYICRLTTNKGVVNSGKMIHLK